MIFIELSDARHDQFQGGFYLNGADRNPPTISLTGVVVNPRSSKFNLAELVLERTAGLIDDGDVIVVSSKFLAISEGRTVDLEAVHPGEYAKKLSAEFHVDERVCELVVRESDEILGGIPGFILALKDGLLTPNAGIDKSNIQHGRVVLYPRRPEESAKALRESVRFASGLSVGVVVCDSRLAPTRRGTIGVAIAASGLEGVIDMRGRRDLFGNVLKVTSQALADDICSAAQLVMGESDESKPLVIVRGLEGSLIGNFEYSPHRFAIPMEDCVYMRSLGVGK